MLTENAITAPLGMPEIITGQLTFLLFVVIKLMFNTNSKNTNFNYF